MSDRRGSGILGSEFKDRSGTNTDADFAVAVRGVAPATEGDSQWRTLPRQLPPRRTRGMNIHKISTTLRRLPIISYNPEPFDLLTYTTVHLHYYLCTNPLWLIVTRHIYNSPRLHIPILLPLEDDNHG